MDYFVFYDDNGDIGIGTQIELFQTKEDVEEFISLRLNQNKERSLSNYKVIHGYEYLLTPVEQITKIKINRKE